MRHRHNKQLPVSAPRPEHELHQRSLVQVATATTVSALAAADALAAVASVTAAGLQVRVQNLQSRDERRL